MSTAAGNHYITKRKSRSGSIPYGNLPLTLDISFQVKCYQSLTPIQFLDLYIEKRIDKNCIIAYSELDFTERKERHF